MTNQRVESKEPVTRGLAIVSVERELVSMRRFRAELGVVPSTCWRWIQRGWLSQPLNIAGRLYLTREQIAEFKERAARGEFAANIKPPHPSRRV
jgi:hypothetical protein